MVTTDRDPPGVWQQLRRRRVTRTAVTYVSVSFALLEGVRHLLPGLGLDEGLGRVLAGAVVLGFPLAIVLAWTYDLTPEGIVRTPDDQAPEAPGPTEALLPRSTWLVLCVLAVVLGFMFRSLRL